MGAAAGRRAWTMVAALAVRVLDAAGAPVAVAIVTFTVTGGGGAVAGSPTTTDASGIARSGGWTLGSAGAQSVEASSPAPGGVKVTFSGLARDPGAGFDVTLWVASPAMTDAQVRAFVNAKERIQQIVVGDLPPVSFSRATVASLGDLGYEVDLSHADSAPSAASSLRAARDDGSEPPVFVGDDLRRSDPIGVDDDGRAALP
jgi:hypothetical protein